MGIAGAIAGYALRAECSPAPQVVKTLASHMVGQGIGEPPPLSSRHPVARPASGAHRCAEAVAGLGAVSDPAGVLAPDLRSGRGQPGSRSPDDVHDADSGARSGVFVGRTDDKLGERIAIELARRQGAAEAITGLGAVGDRGRLLRSVARPGCRQLAIRVPGLHPAPCGRDRSGRARQSARACEDARRRHGTRRGVSLEVRAGVGGVGDQASQYRVALGGFSAARLAVPALWTGR